jgi:hypothetical protein
MPSMPHSSVLSQASSDPDEVVVGVDTHQDVHVAAVLTALGVLQDTKTFPATAAGYQASKTSSAATTNSAWNSTHAAAPSGLRRIRPSHLIEAPPRSALPASRQRNNALGTSPSVARYQPGRMSAEHRQRQRHMGLCGSEALQRERACTSIWSTLTAPGGGSPIHPGLFHAEVAQPLGL